MGLGEVMHCDSLRRLRDNLVKSTGTILGRQRQAMSVNSGPASLRSEFQDRKCYTGKLYLENQKTK